MVSMNFSSNPAEHNRYQKYLKKVVSSLSIGNYFTPYTCICIYFTRFLLTFGFAGRDNWN
jgi:hypothetical protein